MATAVLNPPVEHTLAPTPRQIDEIVGHYHQMLDEAELADERLQECKDSLIALVYRFGIVPAGAEQSVRLEGAINILTVTEGSSVEVKDDAVGKLKAAMEANKHDELFDRLFTPRTKYKLQKNAANQLRIAKLPQRLVKTFTDLYARCFDVKKKSPSLRIERLDAKPASRKKGKR